MNGLILLRLGQIHNKLCKANILCLKTADVKAEQGKAGNVA